MRAEFWENVHVLGDVAEFNQALEHAGRVADFLEFAELMCVDALERNESCGGHFRLEHQTKEGEALRDDDHYCHVAHGSTLARTHGRILSRSRSGSIM